MINSQWIQQDEILQEEITFFEGFVDVDLTRDKVLVVLHIGEDAALVDPVVVMGAKEEDGEVTNIVAEALNVGWHQPRVADLCWPPPAKRTGQGHCLMRRGESGKNK